MSRAPIDSVIHHLRGLVIDPDTAALPDCALLERFLSRRDEAAFEALVRRHGPMVLGVCRRQLPHPQDAEDAFQATFLVLVRKAAGIARRELLGNWLYGVAFQTARAARAAADRRRAKEAKAMPRQPAAGPDERPEWGPVLDEELSRLPDKYRLPVLLCHLQGQSRQEAARALGLAEGTLSSRLARARTLLGRRLARRGLALSGGALAAALGTESTAAPLPPALVVSTVQAGTQALAGAAISASVATLAEKVVKAMWLSKLTLTFVAVLAGGVLALGVGAFASRQIRAAHPAPEEQSPALAAAPVPREDVRPLLRQALEAAQAIPDPREKVSTLLRIADAQNETGDHAGAVKTCRAAVEIARGLPNDQAKVETLGHAFLIQSQAGDRAAAGETLKQAKQGADAIGDANQKRNALYRLVHAQGLVGDYEGALRTAKECGDQQGTALGMFLPMSLRKPDKPAARKALREAVEMMKPLPESQRRQYLPELAKAQVWVGDLAGALQTLDLLDAATWRRVGQQAVAIAQAQTGDVAGALQTLKAMERPAAPGGRPRGPDQMRGRVLQAVVRAQVKAGDKAGAEATLKLLRPLVDDLYVRGPRLAGPARRGATEFSQAGDLERTMALAQYQLGDAAGARRTALGIKSELDKVRALLDLAQAAAAGKPAEARDLLRSADDAAEGFRPAPGPADGPSESRKNSVLWQLAEQQAKLGDVPAALRTAERISTDRDRDTALGFVAPAQAAAGDVKGALGTLGRIKGETKRYALEALVEALVKAGDERGALAVVEQQKSPGLRASALLGLVKARAKEKAGQS